MGKTVKPTQSGQPSDEQRPAPTKESLESIGNHLRVARLERNISLRGMARRIDVSPSFVSQVELGKAKPSLGTLYAFLSELDLSLDELMPREDAAEEHAPPPSSGVNVRRAAEQSGTMPPVTPWPWSAPISPVQRGDSRRMVQFGGVTWQRLTTHDDALVDFLHVTYEVGAESCPNEHLMRHIGIEYGFIVSGSLGVQVGFEKYDLGPGDSISFDSATPHRLSNVGDATSTSIWVVVGRRSAAGGGAPHGDHQPR